MKRDYTIVDQERRIYGVSFFWVITVERNGFRADGESKDLMLAFKKARVEWRRRNSFHKQELKLAKYGFRLTKEAQ